MTSKAELKAYLTTLRGLAKNKGNAYNFVWVGENEIQTTDGSTRFSLKTGVKEEGSCDLTALTTYEIDQSLDLAAHKIDREWVETPELKWEGTLGISNQLADHLLSAFEVVSKDDFRKVLQDVVAKDGFIIGTDGYRAFIREWGEKILIHDFRLTPVLMTAFKRLHKYGNWKIEFLADPQNRPVVCLSNEYFSMTAPVSEDGYPDMVKVLANASAYDTMVEIPLRDLAKYGGKGDKLTVDEDLTLYVENSPTPLKARLTEVVPKIDINNRTVICPCADNKKRLSLDIDMCKTLMAKDGWLRVYWKRGEMTALTIVD